MMDDNFHGTHLAGMVGAACGNGLGVCGVSPVVKLMGCKFLDAGGNGYTSDAVKCLDYALQARAVSCVCGEGRGISCVHRVAARRHRHWIRQMRNTASQRHASPTHTHQNTRAHEHR